jgi:hypothetical protein
MANPDDDNVHAHHVEQVLRTFRGLIGKLTFENFPHILPRMVALQCMDGVCPRLLLGLVKLTVEKASFEPKATLLHSHLCARLADLLNAPSLTFGDALVAECERRMQFKRLAQQGAAYVWQGDNLLPFIAALCARFPLFPSLYEHITHFFSVEKDPSAYSFFQAISTLLELQPPLGPSPDQVRQMAAQAWRIGNSKTAFEPRTRFLLLDTYDKWIYGATPTSAQRRTFYKARAIMQVLANARRLSERTGTPRTSLWRLPVDLVRLILLELAPKALRFGELLRTDL